MNTIDLSHTIHSDMTVFPGTPGPIFRDMNLYEEFGVNVLEMKFDTHTGTHLDVPKHLLIGGSSLSDYDISTFIGQAVLLDCRDFSQDGTISIEILEALDNQIDNKIDYILFRTGWFEKWGTQA